MNLPFLSEAMQAALWPYVLLVIVGFLPSEIWRALAVFASRGLDEGSELLVWVRSVASVLMAGVVAKLLLSPTGALALVPVLFRFGALGVGLCAFFLFRRSVLAAVLVGEAAIIAAATWYAP